MLNHHFSCEMAHLTCENLHEELRSFSEDTFTPELSKLRTKIREDIHTELQHFLADLQGSFKYHITPEPKGHGSIKGHHANFSGAQDGDQPPFGLRHGPTQHVMHQKPPLPAASGATEDGKNPGGFCLRENRRSLEMQELASQPLDAAHKDLVQATCERASVCSCGNIFMADAQFCRKCGRERLSGTGRKPKIGTTRFLMHKGPGDDLPSNRGRRCSVASHHHHVQCLSDHSGHHDCAAPTSDKQVTTPCQVKYVNNAEASAKTVQKKKTYPLMSSEPTLHEAPDFKQEIPTPVTLNIVPEPPAADQLALLPMQVPSDSQVRFSNINEGLDTTPSQATLRNKDTAYTLSSMNVETTTGSSRPSAAPKMSHMPTTPVTSPWSDRVAFIGNRHQNTTSNPSVDIYPSKTLQRQMWCYCPIAADIVKSAIFEYGIIACIIANALTIGIQTDILARERIEEAPYIFDVFETFFCVVFSFELFIRMYVFRRRFFFMPGWKWNIFDFLVVVMQLIEKGLEIINAILDSGTSATGGNFSFMRVMRVLRLIRVLRLVRLLRLISELRTIVDSLIGSLRSLLWTLALLFLLIYIIGLFFTQLVAAHMVSLDPIVFGPDEVLFEAYYGSLPRTILSLFQAMSGGVDWDNMAQPLIDQISPVLGLIMAMYIAFVVLALMNVVTGVFVESALKNARDEQETFMVQYARRLFQKCDLDESGKLNWQEFQQHLNNPDIDVFFRIIDVEVQEAMELFHLLDLDRSGEVDYEEFLNGCLRLRGQAKAIDLVTLLLENRRMSHDWSLHATFVENELCSIAGTVYGMGAFPTFQLSCEAPDRPAEQPTPARESQSPVEEVCAHKMTSTGVESVF